MSDPSILGAKPYNCRLVTVINQGLQPMSEIADAPILNDVEILQIYPDNAGQSAQRAIRFAAGLAKALGADVFVCGTPPTAQGHGFYDLEETPINEGDRATWASSAAPGKSRIVLTSCAPGECEQIDGASVTVELEPWQSEDTLFANSGIAHLLGDPKREPLVPMGNYGAHSIGYAAFAALVAIAVKMRRFEKSDSAIINGEGVLAWVNWKSAVHASLKSEIKRQGEQAEWPVLDCKDGYAAFVYNLRDWPEILKTINDPILYEEKYATFEGRQADRDGYMAPIRTWFKARTKAELNDIFVSLPLPCAPAMTIADLLEDPLLIHRKTFSKRGDGRVISRAPHRIAKAVPSTRPTPASARPDKDLPLSEMRILDFGIITAGAGVSGLLADLGADVLKIESQERFDPFRLWPGAVTKGESPVFKSNNRNKRGVAIDLKTKSGIETFLRLAETADIVLENFRRGVLDRLGIGFDALRAANPNILLASISSQGLDGPGSTQTTFGSTLEASSGFSSVTSYEDGRPVISGRNLNYPDQIVCLYGAAIVAAAAADCRERGIARHIDVSQRDCAIYQLGDVIAGLSGTEQTREAVRDVCGRPHLSRIVKCADDRYVAVTATSEEIIEKIDALNGLDDVTLSAWAIERDASAVVTAFLSAGGGAAVSRTGFDTLTDPGYRTSGIFGQSPNGALVKGFPFQFTETPMTVWGNSPQVGEHTDDVLQSLGLAVQGA